MSYYLGYENTLLIPYQMKLTRKQIKENLEQIPIDRLLLGGAAHGVSLTKKQKAFAEEVVKTGNKTGAYKKAYNHRGKPQTASRNAQTLVNDSKVATYIEALEAAEEARKYLIPARLRDLAIHKITEKALDPAVPPAQQLKALELLGKITEVSLFTHRTETVHLTSSTEIKEQLMKSLRLAMQSSDISDVDLNPADDLLAELSGGLGYAEEVTEVTNTNSVPEVEGKDSEPPTLNENSPSQTPLSPTPQNQPIPDTALLHSIPHNQSDQNPKNPSGSSESMVSVTPVTLTQGKPLEGEGVN